MRLFEFDIQKILDPGITKPLDEDEKYLSDLIRKHCSYALSAMKKTGKFLYHGSDNHGRDGKAVIGNTKTNRYPKDISIKSQSIIDSQLAELGFKALRSNSLFCTGSEIRAREYGKLYYVFPINGFNFTWSPVTYDLYNTVCHQYDGEINDNNFVKKLEFKKTDFADAILSRNEIYINGKFIALHVHSSYSFVPQLIKETTDEII
jgi:hypothetical protein